MKTSKFLRCCVLALAVTLAAVSIIEFLKGVLFLGVCNFLWMLCEIMFYIIVLHNDKLQERLNIYRKFLHDIDKITSTGKPAVITEDEDGKWHLGIGVYADCETSPSETDEENSI